LDPAGMHEMRELIREENRERGVTFLISSHLLDDIERLCDRIGILHKGTIVAEGRLAELLSGAVSGYRIRTARPEAALAALSKAFGAERVRLDSEGTLHVSGDESLLQRMHEALLAGGAPASEVTPVRESLERHFLDLTEGVMG